MPVCKRAGPVQISCKGCPPRWYRYGAFVDQGGHVWDGKQVMFQAYGNNRRINHLCIVRREKLHELFVLVPVDDPPVAFVVLFIQRVHIQVVYDLPRQFPKGIRQAGGLFCMPASGACPPLWLSKSITRTCVPLQGRHPLLFSRLPGLPPGCPKRQAERGNLPSCGRR